MGLSFCLTVRDGCSGLWVTESSCVEGPVFVYICVCVSAGEDMCRNACVCVCLFSWLRAVQLCRSWVRVDLLCVILTALFLFHQALLSAFEQIAEDRVCAMKS